MNHVPWKSQQAWGTGWHPKVNNPFALPIRRAVSKNQAAEVRQESSAGFH